MICCRIKLNVTGAWLLIWLLPVQLGVLRIAFANLDSLDESAYPEFSCSYRGGTTGSYDPADAVYRNRTSTTDYRFYESLDLQVIDLYNPLNRVRFSLCMKGEVLVSSPVPTFSIHFKPIRHDE